MLNFVRELTALRHSSKALGNDGDWQLLSNVGQPYPMVYQRSFGSETYLIALNPSGKKVSVSLHRQSSARHGLRQSQPQ